ncbi:uncharacterized protein LOC130261208 isoform X3 [Oenanthe melanoleuca]|uniref:uncharacterized protein LOC130261208 isoform X3 n=1 Tax=Oenanthe melanoleuca TaxID=2939378 RepID=UPI0024C109E0|nr:uncharacterized protein LOC130261208 isoform X3 [Oenanthe melanoleuca]
MRTPLLAGSAFSTGFPPLYFHKVCSVSIILDSPQESLRQAAIRFLGMAGQHLRGHKRQLRRICQALEDKAEDMSPAIRSQALETAFLLRTVERASGSVLQKLQDQFCRA